MGGMQIGLSATANGSWSVPETGDLGHSLNSPFGPFSSQPRPFTIIEHLGSSGL